MLCSKLDKYQDLGLLILRLGLGAMFLYHGAPKLFGGVETWVKVGAAMKFVGLGFAPAFWGFMAAFAEFVGGLLLMTGLFFRPALLLLIVTMAVAVSMKFATGAGLFGASQALEDGIVFVSLLFIGPGKYSLDRKLGEKLACCRHNI
jgi:putative oxidoreductase